MPDYLPSLHDLQPFLPEAVMILTALVVLLVPVFSPRKNVLAVAVVTTLGLLATLVALNFARPLALAGASYFGGLLVLDPFGWFVKVLLVLFTGLVMALWFVDSHERMVSRGQAGDAPEFFLLLLVATTGMMLMTSATNLLMIFLAVEMASLPSYVLAGFRKTHRLGAEAALKYVLFGAATASVMLYGMSLLYGLFGTLDLAAMNAASLSGPNRVVFMMGVAGLLVGIGFKISMVPVHFWCPDVFEGANIDVTTYLSVASKAAGLALLMRVLMLLTGPLGAADRGMQWLAVVVLILGSVTCFWGNLGAYPQTNIKRLLAFSSIAHAGYMLVAMSAIIAVPGRLAPLIAGALTAEQTAAVHAAEMTHRAGAAETLLFYLFMYVFMNAGVFVTAAVIAQRVGGAASTGENLSDYSGLGRRAPILAGAMMLFCLSLTGIPLTIGFATKLKVFALLFETASWIGWVGLAVVAINTVIGAFFYFRIIKQMYLVPTDLPRVIEIAPATVLVLVLAVPNVVFFLGYNWVDEQAHRHSAVQMPITSEDAAKLLK